MLHDGTGRGIGHLNRKTQGSAAAVNPLALTDRAGSPILDRSGASILTRT